jgi:serine/threonine protein phosphatase PrpC
VTTTPVDSTRSSALRVVVKGHSDIGVIRDENEDSFIIEEPADPEVRAKKGILVVVADGMGGLEDGSTASRMAVDAVLRRYYECPEPPRVALEDAVKQANRAIYQHSRQTGGGRLMGSTLTSIAIVDRHACVAQVGDSRAYCYRAGVIHQVTRDHSLVRELVDMGRIEEASPHFAVHRNVLTRGLGLREDVAVDIYELLDLEDGDRILLSSDGLHELVTPEEMTATLSKHGMDADGACRELIAMARNRGGPDNITAVIACLESEGGASGRKGKGFIFKPPGPTAAASWLLPILLFATFVAGVVLTLLVETPPPLDRESLRDLRATVKAALDEDAPASPAQERAQKLREALEKAQKVLEAAGTR